MKVPLSVRRIHEEQDAKYRALSTKVGDLLLGRMDNRWHYESRIKSLESFALKLESGRFHDAYALEDFFGCLIVVENYGAIERAEAIVSELFEAHARRPRNQNTTYNDPSSFRFEDLRLYVRWRDDSSQPATGLDGVLFEVQIKSYLQHAWGIATHDLLYKGDSADWATARIAFQVKAMLEHAETTIAAARRLASEPSLNRRDKATGQLQEMIDWFQRVWPSPLLPNDLKRLARNTIELSQALGLEIKDIKMAVELRTQCGEGANTVNLSPFMALLQSVLTVHGAGALSGLTRGPFGSKYKLLVAAEVELPVLPPEILARLLRVESSDLSAASPLSEAKEKRPA